MKRLVYTLLFLTSILTAEAQVENKRDSLFTLLRSAGEDTAKVLLLVNIAGIYETNNQDSAIFYLEKSRQLSDQLKFKRGLYLYHEMSTIVSFTKGSYSPAMKHSNEALALAREMNDSKLIMHSLANTGIIYQYLGEFDKQLEYSLMALEHLEKEKLSAMYHNIANAYFNLHQYRRCIDYCLLSLQLDKQIGGNKYINRVYASLGHSYAMLKSTDSALYYYKTALAGSIKMKDDYAVAGIYGYMANAYADRHDFRKMLEAAENSLLVSRRLQSNQMLASSLHDMAYAHYFNDNIMKAKENIAEALEIALQDSLQDELKNIYTVQSYIAAKEGDFKTSLRALQKKDSIQEAVFNEQVIKTTAELEAKYETEKKNSQIMLQQAQLKKGAILNYVFLGSVFIVVTISGFLYLTYKQKQKLQHQRIIELETEKQLAATEAVLKGEEQERTRLAKDLHDGLGGMLSGIKYSFDAIKGNLSMTPENQQAFERSMDMLDSSIKEMRRVAHNMMPETLVRFGLDIALRDYCNDINRSGALKVSYQSIGLEAENIEQTIAITIYRIIQELIGNTLKHAGATTAIVQITKTGQHLAVTVEDDGKGFDTLILRQSRGIGWANIQHRVDFLKGKLDVDSQQGNGTSVHIEFSL